MNKDKKHSEEYIVSQKKIILAEGNDAKWFLIWALEAYKIENIQVIDFKNIENLDEAIKELKATNPFGFPEVTSIIIARDVENKPNTNFKSVLDSINNTLKNNNLSTVKKPFDFNTSTPKIAIILFPCYDENKNIPNGCLEDLCLKIIKDDNNLIEATENYLLDIENNYNHKLTHRHKSKLHAYFSIKSKSFIGARISEAGNRGAFDWQSKHLDSIKQLLKNI